MIFKTHRFQLGQCVKEWDVFWESNPTNIELLVFWGNTAITLITQKPLRNPILLGDLIPIGSSSFFLKT